MCGIVGVASSCGKVRPELISLLRDELSHRGPDDIGLWISDDGLVGLGHQRLSVIDLSSNAHQPMSFRTENTLITFNGEIYNYKELKRELQELGYVFHSESDTEVIIGAYDAWGKDFLNRLNGQFAFAIFDKDTQKVMLARDRAGEKPLYYAHFNHKLIFASELKAILAYPGFPRKLNIAALNDYLTFGYVMGSKSILRDINKLKAAHYAEYDISTNRLTVSRYWEIPAPMFDPHTPAEKLLKPLHELLRNSVQKQLVADVPLGILLSGGMDSSLITAIASKVSSEPVNTFTITFPGYKGYDESGHARLIADHFKTHHTEFEAKPETVELLPLLARQYDEPLADTSIIPTYLISKLIRQYATVALSGDGADELFGGYPFYSWLYFLNEVRKLLPGWTRKSAAGFVKKFVPVGVRGRNHVIALKGDLAYSIAHINMLFDHGTRQSLLRPILGQNMALSDAPEQSRIHICNQNYSWLRQATEADFRTTMVDAYLTKVDRASMLNSLEVRAPFLDFRLIEFAYGQVPDHLKVRGTKRKILLQHLAKQLLPPAFDLSRKQGFIIPMDAWFKKGRWGNYIKSLLLSNNQKIFDHGIIKDLIDGQVKGRNNTRRLFALTMFELWRRQYNIIL